MKLAGLAIAAILILVAQPASGQLSRPVEEGWQLTPNGYGPVRIGMTHAQAVHALGAPLEGEEISEGCAEMGAPGLEGINFMFQNGRLTRISVWDPNGAMTPRGIGIGATEAEVRQAYGSGLDIAPHFYSGPPAKYLTFWLRPGRSGVRFETDDEGSVVAIHAGTDSIEYVEGCA